MRSLKDKCERNRQVSIGCATRNDWRGAEIGRALANLSNDVAGCVSLCPLVGIMTDVVEHILLPYFDDLSGMQVGNEGWIVVEKALDLIVLPNRNFDPHPFDAAIWRTEWLFEVDELARLQSRNKCLLQFRQLGLLFGAGCK